MGIQTPVGIMQRLSSQVSPGAALGASQDALAGSVPSHCSLRPVVPVASWLLPPAIAASWSAGTAWCWGGETLAWPSVMLSCLSDTCGEQQGALLLQPSLGQALPAHVLNLPVSFSVHVPCTTPLHNRRAQPKGSGHLRSQSLITLWPCCDVDSHKRCFLPTGLLKPGAGSPPGKPVCNSAASAVRKCLHPS